MRWIWPGWRLSIVLLLAMLSLVMLPLAARAQLIDPNRGCEVRPDGSCLPLRAPQPLLGPYQFYPTPSPAPAPFPGPFPGPFPEPFREPVQRAPQPADNFMYCYSTSAVPGTKQVFVSNVFQTNQDLATVAEEFSSYSRTQNYGVSFTCVAGEQARLRQQVIQTTINFANRGFSIAQISRR